MIGIIDIVKYRENIIRIWNEAFGDEREYIEFFLDNCPDKTTVGCIEDGRLVSVLFLLDGYIADFSCKYLYAACTLKSYRGLGIMGSLIEHAKIFCRSEGIDFIFLVPGEEGLYEYYRRFGFLEKFTRMDFCLKKEKSKSIALRCTDIDEICRKRQKLLKNQPSFGFNNAVTKYVICEFLNGGGSIYSDENGLIFAVENGENSLVKELLVEKNSNFTLNSQLFQNLTSENIYIQTPLVYNNKNNGCLCTKCGMLYSLTEKAKVYASNCKNIYAGMYLD